ncbi:transporter substrate-binding domain-containing protein [Shewanella sp. VB17]|uniref:substrate-binding periplasmic protein n=1 Tax=Shewanella sp. VB17 TaxID=2739432 RepID=UPI0015662F33|nr:transporter substrate-binding domain-containing protein [Shewanella sp. VB17]NRD74796.1 transporter substrate-binding domain-containing protein [Shewanella sp. VB17]
MHNKNVFIVFWFCMFSLFFTQKIIAVSLEKLVVLAEDYPPYNYLSEDGELKGIAVDLLVAAYKKAGIKLNPSYIKVQPWPRSYRQLEKDENTMLFSMTRTPARESLFRWAGPISKTKVVLIAKKSRKIRVGFTCELTNYFIGGILDDIGIQLVRELLGYNTNILTSPYANSLAKMLDRERIDLWAYEENTAKLFFERNNLDPNNFESIYTLSESELFYAFSLKTDQKIVDRLQKAIDEVRGNE